MAEPGGLIERLVDLVEVPGPQLRAVAVTLLIKAVDLPDEEMELMEAMVASDDAAAMIDPVAAAEAGLLLRRRLGERLGELAASHGEAAVARAMRDYLAAQAGRWASRAVDDAGNRRRAERFLAWAERPGQLAAAQRRGLFAGMTVEDFRRLARTGLGTPVTAEAVLSVWREVEDWVGALERELGEAAIGAWEAGGGR